MAVSIKQPAGMYDQVETGVKTLFRSGNKTGKRIARFSTYQEPAAHVRDDMHVASTMGSCISYNDTLQAQIRCQFDIADETLSTPQCMHPLLNKTYLLNVCKINDGRVIQFANLAMVCIVIKAIDVISSACRGKP